MCKYVTSEVFTAGFDEHQVFWVILCCVLNGHQHCGGVYCFHLKGLVGQEDWAGPIYDKDKALLSPRMSVTVYQFTFCNNLDHLNLQSVSNSLPATWFKNKIQEEVNYSVVYLLISTNFMHQSFIISLFQASTCFEHMCWSSGGQNCTVQSLVSSLL